VGQSDGAAWWMVGGGGAGGTSQLVFELGFVAPKKHYSTAETVAYGQEVYGPSVVVVGRAA